MSRWPAVRIEDAADRLGITPAAIARALATFEDEDGVKLVSVVALAAETKHAVSTLVQMFAGFLIEDPDFGE